MALEKQTISWPLTGGIDTKTSPIAVVPGSFLTLDNVRQTRANEWVPRPGTSHGAADDTPDGLAMLRTVPLPRGGMLGQSAEPSPPSSQAATLVYVPTTGSSPRWLRSNINNSSFTRPKVWSRRGVSTSVQAPSNVSHASSGTITITAWWSSVDDIVHVVIYSAAEGDSLTGAADDFIVQTPGRRPKCSYNANGNILLLTWVDVATGDVKARSFSGTTGAAIAGPTSIGVGAHAVDPYLDTLYYTGTNSTVVFRTAGSQIRFVEVNPTTLATPTNAAVAVNCNTVLALFQDPDASAIRFVASYDTAGAALKVLRLNTAGAIQTTDTIAEATAIEQVAGVAYQAGAGWMAVYETAAALKAVKKRTAVVSALVNISGFTGGRYSLATGAWREPGEDTMRYTIRYRGAEGGGGVGGSFVDRQRTYYEMALEFENGAATISKNYLEAQSRMLPFEASGNLANASLSHVHRTGTGAFETALIRLARFDIAAAVETDNWAIDRWQVLYPTSANIATANIGDGLATGTTAYLPDGQLLQTASGELICGHGGSTVPIVSALTPGVGAGALTATAAYQYCVSEDLWDDAGNVWHGPASTPQRVTLAGAQNQVTVAAWYGEHESRIRKRTVKFWRTAGNGSVFRLIYSVTNLCNSTIAPSFLDVVSDANLAQSEFLPTDQPAGLTPAFSHIAQFGNRLWGVERDFPQNVRFSKPLQAGFAPEFPDAFVSNVEDATGAPTAFVGTDDKIVIYKPTSIYVSSGQCPDNTGAGPFPEFFRINSDVGSVGPHVVSTGSEVFFASQRGLHRLLKSQEVEWFAELDRYFNQSDLVTRETVVGAVFSPQQNEIRFQTTNYRFVYDRDEKVWIRDTGGMAGAVITSMVGQMQAIFRSNGQTWFEVVPDDAAANLDVGVAYTGIIRSPWIGAIEGWLRLYRARIVGLRTDNAAGTLNPSMRIYFDNDDTLFESSTGILSGDPTFRGEMRPRRQKCSRFSLELTIVEDQSVRLEAWAVQIGLKRGSQPLTQNDRWA